MNVLVLLATHHGKLILREEFMDQVWPGEDISDEVLTRAISQLRKTFKQSDPETSYIETIPRKGYVLRRELLVSGHPGNGRDQDEKPSISNDGEAVTLYLQGCSLMERPFTKGVLENAVDYLQQALELDGDFAECHSALGSAYTHLATYSADYAKPGLFKLAAECGEKANALSPEDGFPLTLIGMYKFIQGQIAEALELTFRACQLSPNDPEVSFRLGYFLAMIGHTQDAIAHYEHAISLNPTNGRYLQCLAIAKLCNDELDEAENLAKKAIDFQHLFAHDTYAAVAYAKGQDELAANRFTEGCYAMYTMFSEEFGDPDKWKNYSGLVYSRDPEVRVQVCKWVRGLCEKPGEPPTVPLMAGLLRTGSAEAIFEVCNEDRPPVGSHGFLLRIWGKVDTCRMIYNHPDFMAFAKRIGLAKAWVKYGMPDRLSGDTRFIVPRLAGPDAGP